MYMLNIFIFLIFLIVLNTNPKNIEIHMHYFFMRKKVLLLEFKVFKTSINLIFSYCIKN